MSDALNIPLTDDWRHEINHQRHEIDLVLIIKDLSLLVQEETKAGQKSEEEKAVRQVEWGKEYLERTHGQFLQNLTYLPALAMPNPALRMPPHRAANCSGYYLRDSNFPTFGAWWNKFLTMADGLQVLDQDEYEAIVQRLILHSSLAFTSLPQQLSMMRGTHLILLR